MEAISVRDTIAQLNVEELVARLEEAEATLRAIREGAVDALVVSGHEGPQVFTLEGADLNYRVFLQEMSEGAVSMAADGTIVYANPSFARLAGKSLSDIPGECVLDFVAAEYRAPLAAALANPPCKFELELTAPSRRVPVFVSVNRNEGASTPITCAVFTDLTDQKLRDRLRVNEERLRLSLSAGQMATWDWDIRTGDVTWNDEHFRMLGYDVGSIVPSYQAWLDRIHPDDVGHADRVIRGAMLGGDARVECRTLWPDGTIRWIDLFGSFQRDANGEAIRGYGVAVDITERKCAERVLAQSELRYRTLVDATGAVTWSCTPSGQVISPQPAWMAFSGQTPADSAGMGWARAIHPEDSAAVFQKWGHAAARCEPFSNEQRMRRYDSQWRWMNVYAAPVRDPAGELLEWIGMCLDITERKQAEETLRRNAETFAALVEQSPLGIYTVDSQFRVRHVSVGAMSTFRNVPSIIGRDFAEVMRTIWPEPFASDAIRIFRHTLETGEPYVSAGFSEKRHDIGVLESYEWQLNRITLADGQPGVVCYFFDSTRLQRALKEVRESEQRFRAFTSATSDIVYRMSPDWTEMRHLQGRDFVADTLEPSLTWLDRYIDPNDHARVLDAIRHAIQTRSVFELEHRLIRIDGSLGWTYSRAVPIFDPSGEIVEWFGAASDITERKLAEEAARKADERLRSMANAAPALISETDDTGVVFVNQHYLDFLGVEFEAVRGMGWVRFLHADDVDACIAAYRVAFERQQPYTAEARLRRADGAWRWFLNTGCPAGDGRFVGFAADITDQKQIEGALRAANDDLNRYAYAMAHDLREPIRNIGSSTQMLTGFLTGAIKLKPERIERLQKSVASNVERMDQLLADLLQYSQAAEQIQEPPLTDLNRVLAATLANLNYTITASGANITAGLLPVLSVKESEMVSVFQNLIGNAIKYRRPDVTPQINIRAERGTGEWIISVEDNGEGIEPEFRDRVFGMFKRLHGSEIPGTGMGLAICERIVTKYRGRIWVESSPGHGSTFRFSWPAGPLDVGRDLTN